MRNFHIFVVFLTISFGSLVRCSQDFSNATWIAENLYSVWPYVSPDPIVGDTYLTSVIGPNIVAIVKLAPDADWGAPNLFVGIYSQNNTFTSNKTVQITRNPNPILTFSSVTGFFRDDKFYFTFVMTNKTGDKDLSIRANAVYVNGTKVFSNPKVLANLKTNKALSTLVFNSIAANGSILSEAPSDTSFVIYKDNSTTYLINIYLKNLTLNSYLTNSKTDSNLTFHLDVPVNNTIPSFIACDGNKYFRGPHISRLSNTRLQGICVFHWDTDNNEWKTGESTFSLTPPPQVPLQPTQQPTQQPPLNNPTLNFLSCTTKLLNLHAGINQVYNWYNDAYPTP